MRKTSFDGILTKAMRAIADWYNSRRPAQDVEPQRGIICIGLAILEHMREHFPLKPEHYLTQGNQVQRTGGPQCQRLLARFGENRTFLREGGRTTRGSRPAAESLAERLNAVREIEGLTSEEREELMNQLQKFFADRATEFLNSRHIEVELSLDKPVSQFVTDILKVAAQKNLAGSVAQHLVGAKLALRFPKQKIPNHSSTTADEQLGRPGDFIVGDTAIHVTTTPMQPLFDKIADIQRRGYRSRLLVPEFRLAAARQLAEVAGLQGKVEVSSIEPFISQNIEELSEFSRERLSSVLFEFMSIYNERVSEVETNPALLLEIPTNLRRSE